MLFRSVSIPQVERDLDTLQHLGFQAVTVQAGFNMPFAYLSPEYFAFFRNFVAEAKQRNMRVWIVDDAGYPSGFAGGKFTTEKPELRMQALEVARKIPVAGGATINEALPPETVSAAAVDQDGAAIPIPLVGNTLEWTAPKGKWTVLIVDHEFRTSPTRSDTNPQRVKDTSQSLEDYLDPAATEQYLRFTHEQYKQAVGDEFGKTIMGFRGDEPDYSIPGLPWTPKFFERFTAIKGYDVQPYAALFAQAPSRRDPGVAIHLTPEQIRIEGDYYDVFSQMFAAGFFKPQADWCAANHLEYQVHLNHEELEMELTRSEGSFFRDMRAVEVPGIDAIWHQIWKDTISDFPRLASSAAHVYGKPRAFTESFAAYRPVPDITQARYILNEQLVRGINVMETMNYSAARPASAAPAADPPAPPTTAGAPAAAPPRRGGPSAVMRDPGFPALADYVRRVGYVMSMGRPGASVALYLPSSSMWLNDRDADTAFVATEQMLSERQIDFDIINQDALATDLQAGLGPTAGSFRTMSGNDYFTVIIPSAAILSEAELDRLRTFAKGGGRVLFLGATPSIISGKTILDARAATPADFDFATVETSAQLPPTPTPPAQAPSSPPGPQIVPPAIEAALNKVIPRRAVTLDAPDTALKVNTRYLEDARVYLFFNEGAQPVSHTVTLSAGGSMKVEAWDPATGAVAPMAATPRRGSVTVKLDLKPYEMKLITIK